MYRWSLQRDEEAASSAIATVMMFAGVLSIISLMLLSIVPVINELEGAIEVSDATAQLEDLAEYEDQLARRGLPGTKVEMLFDPIHGDLSWDVNDGGVWFSAAWNEGQHLRLREPADLDDVFQLRYPNGALNAYCTSDLHIHEESLWNYRLPDMDANVLFTLAGGSSEGLENTRITLTQGTSSQTYEIGGGQTALVDLPLENQSGEASLVSSVELVVLIDRGEGGATFISPIDIDHLGTGTYWEIPMPAGTNKVTVFSNSDFIMRASFDGTVSEYSAIMSGDGAELSTTFSASAPETLSIEVTASAHLLLQTSSPIAPKGGVAWPANDGSFLSTEYLLPRLSGTLVAQNPSGAPIIIGIQGADYSVPSSGILKLDWPLSGTVGTIAVQSDEPVILSWTTGPSSNSGFFPEGLDYIIAKDTGMRSGKIFSTDWSGENVAAGDARLHVIPAGSTVSSEISGVFNASISQTTASPASVLISSGEGEMEAVVIDGHALRLLRSAGNSGAIQILDNGKERCLPLSIQASGWISASIPWDPVSKPTPAGIRAAWSEGTYPSGMHISIRGPSADAEFSALADGWAVHIPVLKYRFASSIEGLEVVNRGGVVATNHPEQNPHIVHSALSSRGSGSMLGIHIPVTMPASGSIVGGSAEVVLRLEMEQRTICSMEKAADVRMGWHGSYGDTVAQWLAQDLAHSDDWIAFPEQLDLLSDYVGWVDRSGGEAVYHSPNQDIDLSLSMSAISLTAVGVGA